MSKIDRIKEIASDSRWWGFYVQRRFQKPSRRNSVADTLACRRPSPTIIDQTRAIAGATDLNGSGLHLLGEMLSVEQCQELLTYFEGCKVTDPYRRSEGEFLPMSAERPKEAHIAHHKAADIVAAPYLMDIANDPRVLDVVAAFLGCKPTIGYMATWWSYPTGMGAQQAENFHRDVDDWRFVKLFLYLTEVDEVSGPHKYVLHSATSPQMTEIRRLEDAEVAATFGEDNIKTMTSKAGHAFLENTYGVHKGQPLQQGRRLLFQVVYTLSELPYAPKSPVASFDPASGHDHWTNRVYLK